LSFRGVFIGGVGFDLIVFVCLFVFLFGGGGWFKMLVFLANYKTNKSGYAYELFFTGKTNLDLS